MSFLNQGFDVSETAPGGTRPTRRRALHVGVSTLISGLAAPAMAKELSGQLGHSTSDAELLQFCELFQRQHATALGIEDDQAFENALTLR